MFSGDKLYIIMDFIDGAPLADYFNSLKEKQQRFTEERLWNISIQVCFFTYLIAWLVHHNTYIKYGGVHDFSDLAKLSQTFL